MWTKLGQFRCSICMFLGLAAILFLLMSVTRRDVFHTTAKSSPVESSLRRGAYYLVASQHAGGEWSDFDVPGPGTSDVWVTAMIASCINEALLATQQTDLERPLARATQWLRSLPVHNRFGYNRLTPCDADSTAWAARLFAYRADPPNPIETDLRQFQKSDGGVCTYNDARYGMWSEPSPDVTANACLAHEVVKRTNGSELIDYRFAIHNLLERQLDDGHWAALWWKSRYYSTSLAIEVLVADRGFPEPLGRALRFIRASQNDDGGWGSPESNTMDTACAVFSLSIAVRHLGSRNTPNVTSLSAGRHWLLTKQNPDGSWPGSSLLRVPRRDTMAFIEEARTYEDGNRNVSTAFAVRALAMSSIAD